MDKGWMAVWPVAAFFLGGLATQLTGWINYRRQRADKAADDAAAIEQRREEFELAHLVEFNGLLRQNMACLYELSTAVERYRRAESRDDLTAEHGIALRAAGDALESAEASVNAQLGFILDDAVRGLAQEAAAEMDSTSAYILDGDNVTFDEVRAKTDAAYRALSERVRVLYAGRPVAA
ncbi:hypothetical protein JHN49_11265 [Streptomyces sp. MBT57]|nr:hypothetical protein [Streptomyces sp. MBT57]